MQLVSNWSGFRLPDSSSFISIAFNDLTLNPVEFAEIIQCLASDQALLLAVQIEKLRRACAMQPASVNPLASSAL